MDEGSVELVEAPRVIDVPDLVNLIADFCDDESLSKLSRVSQVQDKLLGQQGGEKDDHRGEQGPLHKSARVQVHASLLAHGGTFKKFAKPLDSDNQTSEWRPDRLRDAGTIKGGQGR